MTFFYMIEVTLSNLDAEGKDVNAFRGAFFEWLPARKTRAETGVVSCIAKRMECAVFRRF